MSHLPLTTDRTSASSGTPHRDDCTASEPLIVWLLWHTVPSGIKKEKHQIERLLRWNTEHAEALAAWCGEPPVAKELQQAIGSHCKLSRAALWISYLMYGRDIDAGRSPCLDWRIIKVSPFYLFILNMLHLFLADMSATEMTACWVELGNRLTGAEHSHTHSKDVRLLLLCRQPCFPSAVAISERKADGFAAEAHG